MAWNYQRQEQQFPIIPEGEYRIRIKDAEMAKSRVGNDMIVLQFDVSGRSEILWHRITFLQDKPEVTNRNLTKFFDSFKGIPEGDFNVRNWIGKVGACRIKHEESDYNGGTTQARVHYFIAANKQDALPAWKEPVRKSKDDAVAPAVVKTDADGWMQVEGEVVDDDGLPLF